ncbi:hypothetical protein T484DRAFT_1918696 [Baffinella frigidus]|nr:hypothetical protein T484DRAFT_1918696 [Cryptophyta sp. CCMP2293]
MVQVVGGAVQDRGFDGERLRWGAGDAAAAVPPIRGADAQSGRAGGTIRGVMRALAPHDPAAAEERIQRMGFRAGPAKLGVDNSAG